MPFLTAKREEVVDIMDLLYNQEAIWELDLQVETEKAEQRGVKKGEQRGLLRAIQSLVKLTGISIEQAMASLEIAETERPAYRTLLEQGQAT